MLFIQLLSYHEKFLLVTFNTSFSQTEIHALQTTCSLTSPVKPESAIKAEQMLSGQITKVLPNRGLYVRLPTHKCGLVALTDLRDSYVENPLEGFEVSQLVR